ncbi:hypothetical protein CMI40_02270 [Candidatus Pacearchaeota archaeon]|jgi:hypothetical protein|nr:hypothetical protein [Candidatus Pacearchaeota archaeon]|tara:strand:- start:4109 stop:4585 length:477 start_codon:yes stop_codon:yes gene_type:complete
MEEEKYLVFLDGSVFNKVDSRFYINNEEEVEKSLENSINVPYDQESIPTNRFGEEEITNFCFGKSAKDYGLFLKDAGINEMALNYLNDREDVDCGKGSFINQLHFSDVSYWKSALKNWTLLGSTLGVYNDFLGVLKNERKTLWHKISDSFSTPISASN